MQKLNLISTGRIFTFPQQSLLKGLPAQIQAQYNIAGLILQPIKE